MFPFPTIALAFCNWSQVQKTRRALARRFCHSSIFADRAQDSLNRSADWLSTLFHQHFSTNAESQVTPDHGPLELKQLVHEACANAFFGFFCSEMFEDRTDKEFSRIVRLFDDIFYEINQSHPTDVLPALAPFFRGHLNHLAQMGTAIRDFVVQRIINPHL